MLDQGLLYGVPKVRVNRMTEKDSMKLLEKYSSSFADFLLHQGLCQYLPLTIFDYRNDFVTANFKVENETAAKSLVARLDDKIGIIGEQKLKVSMKNQTITTVNQDIFKLLKDRFQEISDALVIQNTRYKLQIYTKEPKHGKIKKISIFVESQHHLLNA
jgi:hypothetical protein